MSTTRLSSTSGRQGLILVAVIPIVAWICYSVAMLATDAPGEPPANLVYHLGKADVEEVQEPEFQWRDLDGHTLNMTNRHPQAWMRFEIPASDEKRELLLLVGPGSNRYDLFLHHPDGSIDHHGGAFDRISRGPLSDDSYRVDLEPGATLTGYASFVATNFFYARIRLIDNENIPEVLRRTYMRNGITLALAIFVVLIAALLFALSREKPFAYYLIYLVSAIAVTSLNGGVLRYMNVELEDSMQRPIMILCLVVAVAAYVSFALSYLNIKDPPKYLRFIRYVTQVARVLITLAGLALLLDLENIRAVLLAVVVLTLCGGPLALGIATMIHRPAAGYLFVCGTLILIVALVLNVLTDLGIMPGTIGTDQTLTYIGLLGEAMFFNVALAHLSRKRYQERLAASARLQLIEHELTEAVRVHSRFLPQEEPGVNAVSITSRYLPAVQLGGDLYGYYARSTDELFLYVADVAGHGLGAALDASAVWTAFQSSATAHTNTTDVIRSMNELLHPHLGFRFVTGCVARIDTRKSTIEFTSAGHVPPILVRDGQAEILDVTGILLGFDPAAEYDSIQLSLRPGDRFLIYSDGLVESHSRGADEEGYAVLRDLLERHSFYQRDALASTLLKGMEEWRNDPTQSDDITLLIVDIPVDAS